MPRIIFVAVIVVLLTMVGFFVISNQQPITEPTETLNSPTPQPTVEMPTPVSNRQASFAIFTNGTFRVFTAAMYHNLSPDVYIEATQPNVVQVRKAGVTWSDFFATLPFSLTAECLTTGTKQTFCTGSAGTLQFYLNGVSSSDALNQEIKNGDKLLVTFGNESAAQIQAQINKIP